MNISIRLHIDAGQLYAGAKEVGIVWPVINAMYKIVFVLVIPNIEPFSKYMNNSDEVEGMSLAQLVENKLLAGVPQKEKKNHNWENL